MKEIYREAFSEVDAIFELMPQNLLNKIPEKIKQIIKEEKAKEYKPIIIEPIENLNLKEETLIILSLIYRDFLCDEQEKMQLQLRDTQKLKEAEEMLREKYNPDNLFKKNKIENVKESSNTEDILDGKKDSTLLKEELIPVIVKDESIWGKLKKLILKLFQKNK